ncbi:hypothetical protein JVU11DRAFT_1000 [Chiua virens]|nr:hypothetical protein JVU11DRAFT_1000 [Chiua virens]
MEFSNPKIKAQGANNLTRGVEVTKSLLAVPSVHAKIIAFELQCPLPFRVWRSSIVHLLYRFDNTRVKPFCVEPQSKSHDLLSDIPELRPYLAEHLHKKSPPYSQFNLAFFYPQSHHHTSPRLGYAFKAVLPRSECSKWQGIGDGPLSQHVTYHNFFTSCVQHRPVSIRRDLATYVRTATHTSNDVLSAQTICPSAFSLDELVALGHLGSGSSLQWINILRELRSRTLNFRSHEVHFLLTEAISQVGPLDVDSGEWVWHQELQNHSFCDILLNELESLFLDVAAGSLDQVTMRTISLLLTRVLASSPCESVSERALLLLQRIRNKTLEWVQELAYNLIQGPMNEERRMCLRGMAATCRSTFDISTRALNKLLLSPQDVDALLSSAFFTHSTSSAPQSSNVPECASCQYLPSMILDHSELLHQRDCRLSITLEGVLENAIQSDASDRGIDLAVRNLWPGYRPGPQRWEPAEHRDSHQFICTTATSGDTSRRPLLMHIDLLNESLLVDGRPLGSLPCQIQRHPLYKEIFDEQVFVVTPSDLPGMDYATLATISDHRVSSLDPSSINMKFDLLAQIHFSLRGEDLVIQAQCQNTDVILELIPSEKFKGDLPTFLVITMFIG